MPSSPPAPVPTDVPPTDALPPCVIVIPVKPPAHGKSRLAGHPFQHLTDGERRDLAEAFALDTVEAVTSAVGAAAVLVVTDDFRLAAAMRAQGCEVIPDGVSEDLNATLVQAAAEVVRRWPSAVPVALCADLPGLLPDELVAVLTQVAACVATGGSAFVRDRAGVGTTLYAAAGDRFAPHFGVDSAARHEAAGAVEVGSDAASVRADVDDLTDLGAALVAGVGQHTSRACGRRATPPG